MEAREQYLFPAHGICVNSDELKQRGIKKDDFDNGSSAENPKLVKACADCPVQVECFDDAVDAIKRDLPILGVRAGESTSDISTRVYRSKPESPEAHRIRLSAQQEVARQVLKGSLGSRAG